MRWSPPDPSSKIPCSLRCPCSRLRSNVCSEQSLANVQICTKIPPSGNPYMHTAARCITAMPVKTRGMLPYELTAPHFAFR